MKGYLVGSDCGDSVAALVVIRHLGLGHIRLFETPGTKGWPAHVYNYIRPLIEIQPYCESVAMFNPSEELPITHDFTGFRNSWGKAKLLWEKVAVHAGLNPAEIDAETPWVTVPDAPRHGKIVVVRSARHRGYLQYFRLWQHKHADCLFLGTQEEHEQFKANDSPFAPGGRIRSTIAFAPTKNAVEAAQLIMGSRLFVGNATFFSWLAFALGHQNMLLDCAESDTEFISPRVRNVRTVKENPKSQEWSKM